MLDHYHGGIDLQADIGANIHAIIGGTVDIIKSGCNCDTDNPLDFIASCAQFCGNSINIDSSNVRVGHCHLSKITARENQLVRRGMIIGKVGITGNACDHRIVPHLHLTYSENGTRVDPSGKFCTDIDRPNIND